MAGGTFLSQNKVRPGAYINFKGVTQPVSSLGTRGVMTMPVPMSWGAQITELLSTDLVDGKSLEKIGYVGTDEEAQIYREALKNAYKAIIFRLDTGGVKAKATIAPLTATAKYAGVVGNDISVAIVANGSKFDVITYFKGAPKDVQTVSTVADLVDNAWVDFSGSGAIVANAGVPLTTGTNGTVSDATYATYLNLIKSYKWNTMAIPQDASTVNASVISFIKNQRDVLGKKVQAVLYNADADHEGIISVAQGYLTNSETVSPTTFVAYVAGLTAGANVNESNTYHVIEGAVSIVYPVGVTPYGEEEIIAALKAGKFVLSTRQDGAVVVEQDINTLHTFTNDKGYPFSKNRVIRVLDEVANKVSGIFENGYIGKVTNDEDGRNVFKSELIQYFQELASVGAIKEFDGTADIDVQHGNAIDAIVVNVAIQPMDSMEKLYMTVMVG